MTQEDRELLFKDLCARLPYGVKLQKVYDDTYNPVELYLVDLGHHTVKFYKYKGEGITICDVGDIERFGQLRFKPYLFPLSSMTEEQKYTCPIGVANLEAFIKNESWTYLELTPDSIIRFVDWLNKNHFDYRGLIEQGLAVDATGLNVY